MTDNRLALQMLDALSPGSDSMWFLTIPGPPHGTSRARYVKRLGEKIPVDLKSDARASMRRTFQRPLTGNLAVGCVFFRHNRQRLDVDNMLKHVCDSATGIAWLDDSQVTAVMGRVEFDEQNPRTVLLITRHESSLVRDRGTEKACKLCGKYFVAETSKPQFLCSRDCQAEWQRNRNRSRRLHPHEPCLICGAKTSKPGVKRCRLCWTLRSREHTEVPA